MGTFETGLEIPDLRADQKYLPISSVVLSYQREKLASAVATAEKNKKLIAANPLVQNDQKLVPSVTRVFGKDHDMYVYLEAYQLGAETTQQLTGGELLSRQGGGVRECAAENHGRPQS